MGEEAPDRVFVPTGDGCILGGVYKGFKDLLQFGLIKKMPRITAVQAEGSNALHRALQNGSFDYRSSSTVADSISVDIPRNGYTQPCATSRSSEAIRSVSATIRS